MTSVCVVVGLLRGAAGAVSIETVPVGNPGNAADTRYETPGYGSVGYTYNIGKYEVTAGQYTAFLNAVAATDTYGLYNTSMSRTDYGSGISRSGSAGSYSCPGSSRLGEESRIQILQPFCRFFMANCHTRKSASCDGSRPLVRGINAWECVSMQGEPRPKRSPLAMVAWSVVLGGLVGIVIPVVVVGDGELIERISWAASGGRGEKAEWGEPLYYAAVVACLTAPIGAIIGALVMGAVSLFVRR